MKKENVPQHDENLLNGIKEIQYAVDEKGNYTQVKSVGWKPKNDALKQAVNLIDELIEDARQQVISGNKSPVFFYMHLKQMDYSILKQYTGFSKIRIKKHCRNKAFNNPDNNILKKYAECFGITVEQLKTVPQEPVKSLDYNFNFKLENNQTD
ncbi:MAG: hypothetical protein K8R54_08200 [Bacteroidales bacterium]|nr:hypothetical protein [Bacteroidales bacterium]